MGEGTKILVASVVLTALIFGVGSLWGASRRAERLDRGPGELKDVFLAQGKEPLWVALETLEFSSEDSDETVWRLSAYDPKSGTLVARKKEVPWSRCASAGPGRLWCVSQGAQLAVLSLPTLEEAHGVAKVSASIGQKVMNASSLDTTPGGALLAQLADGRQLQLDPETLQLSPPPPAPARARPETGPFEGLTTCSLPNSARMGYCRWGDRGSERVDQGDGFLRPERLPIDPVQGRMLVLARTSLDDATAMHELLSLDERLVVQRRVTLAPAKAGLQRAAWVPEAKVLLLAFGAPEYTTVAVDLEAGERFRIRH